MIELINLARSWGNFTLSNINLNVTKGEFFGLFGHNGAGKTLLMETIAGIWIPQEGQVWINGKELTNMPPEERNIGFVYQEPLLFPHLSVKENICYGLRARRFTKEHREQRFAELVELLKLNQISWRKNVDCLSGGEKQKVALARALAGSPEVILLDEPAYSLDEQSCQIFYSLLKDLNQRKKITIILISHDYVELKGLVCRIGIMQSGRIIRIDEVVSI
ncbi:MAG: hypothetical protein A3J51_06650 [Omnitrophica WOR_2 bacterium RIFCSPHIGHO2_02_FULL_45_21]|nr:MAG: hypothetical protein A3J51_06650 [Omnitrophica WOR_2 bacterium RIFCSPHIGHO2_02_FULL_45_21]